MQRILLVSSISLHLSLLMGSAVPGDELHKQLLRPSAVKTVINASFSELLKLPDKTCAKYGALFIQNVVGESLDIDTLSYQDTTIGDYINDPNNTEPVLAYLREGFQAYRSNPPYVFTFRLHIDEILSGTKEVSVLEEFLKDKIFNVDLIKYDANKTLAERLHEHERGKVVLELPRIASFNERAHDFKKHLEWALDDGITGALKVCYQEIPLGVDQLLFVPGKTVGQHISEQIGRRKGALAVAALVQPDRTDDSAVITALYNVWEKAKMRHKEQILNSIKEWYAKYPVNVDEVNCAPDHAKTLGVCIAQQIGEPKTRVSALELARVVQNKRSDQASVFRTLLKSYESDRAVVDDMKKWVQDFPLSDSDLLAYDSTLSMSIAAKIDALGDEALKALLDRSAGTRPRNNPNSKDPHADTKNGWSTSQKLGVLALSVGAVIGYYYLIHKDPAKKTDGEDSVAAISLRIDKTDASGA